MSKKREIDWEVDKNSLNAPLRSLLHEWAFTKKWKKIYILQVFHHLFPFLLSYATGHRISAGSGIFAPSNFFGTEFPPFCILRITYTCKKLLTGAILCFQDYYFISTSSPDDLHNMEGGYCRTHNMKVVFKVGPNSPAAVLTQRCISFLNPCIPTTQFLLISLFQHMSKFSLQFHSRPNIASLFTRALPQKWPSSLHE